MNSLVNKLSLASFANENTLSLANLKFDFSMVKLEVPLEYERLGLTISPKRRLDAEDGSLHRTARRLGALFEGSLPATKDLFRAYGKRASEVSSALSHDSSPSDKGDNNNIFAGHTGVDSATIWAAATSGTGAIAVHLLACMLARMFISSEATSVWVELVEKQKEHIITERDEALFTENHDSCFLAASQDIPRSDLARWDASARAWVQSADQAKARQHKQMMLILDNAQIPVNNEPSTYQSVMKAWVSALTAMDNLIKGMPQQVQDSSALLGISSWHLYPDMLLFGNSTAEIKQRDPLFEGNAVLTLGLELANDQHRSVSWSLPLARLQYYGDPVRTARSTGHDNSRITPDQFAFVILGCIFESWGYFGSNTESALSRLHEFMELIRIPLRNAISDRRPTPRDLSWLEYLDVTAQKYAQCNQLDGKLASQLLSLGRRRSGYINNHDQRPSRFFGLAELDILIPLIRNDTYRIEQLRVVARRHKLSHKLFMIRYQPSQGPFLFEYTTTRPRKFELDSEGHITRRHVCWLPLDFIELEKLCEMDSSQFRRSSPVWKRHDELVAQGSLCFPVLETLNIAEENPNPYMGFWTKKDFLETAKSLVSNFRNSKEFECSFTSRRVGGADEAAIFQLGPSMISMSKSLSPRDMIDGLFTSPKLDINKVIAYFTGSGDQQSDFIPYKACAAVSNIYTLLPQATITTLVLGHRLGGSGWIGLDFYDEFMPTLTREQVFACISMFETGYCDIDPSSLREVFAISSGNSLFVANALLADPHEKPVPSDVRRMLGNIGRPGLSFLVPPTRTKIRVPNLETWKEINHLPFDGRPEDCFSNTSVHLSFTEYEMPLGVNDHNQHYIDRPVKLIESLISVFDRGKWVTDLDVLKALSPEAYAFHSEEKPPLLCRLACRTSPNSADGFSLCGQGKSTFSEACDKFPILRSTSIDNWEELLDPPSTGTLVVRAYKNWLARLALATVCAKFRLGVIILGKEACWPCCAELMIEIGTRKRKLSRTGEDNISLMGDASSSGYESDRQSSSLPSLLGREGDENENENGDDPEVSNTQGDGRDEEEDEGDWEDTDDSGVSSPGKDGGEDASDNGRKDGSGTFALRASSEEADSGDDLAEVSSLADPVAKVAEPPSLRLVLIY